MVVSHVTKGGFLMFLEQLATALVLSDKVAPSYHL